MQRRALVVLILLVAACTSSDPIETTTTTTVSSTTTTTAPALSGCADPGIATESGVVADIENSGSDARSIGPISWDQPGDCERLTIAFQSSEGAPATTTPSVRVEHLDGLPILRVTVSSTESMISDQIVESALVDRLFVVSSLQGDTFIDFHLRNPVLVRMTTAQAPAEIELELWPGIIDPTARPTVTDSLVVVSPQDGTRRGVPILVTGYAWGFTSGVLVMATAGTSVLYEQVQQPAEGPGWVEFRVSLSLPRGPALVFVGEDQPGPAGLAGVVIPITVE